jgi:hypothetical protein
MTARSQHGRGTAATCAPVRQRSQWSAAAGSARSATGRAVRGARRVGEEGGAVQVGGVHGEGTDEPRPASASGPRETTARVTRGVDAASAFQSASACETFSSSPV